mmetsp:Transcript_80287/g.159587  ORF Transcript_80287/g.159587 Transcript_80287/m.159587 type:complete len:115 (+) Transcript_80287:1332-1676(+)
MSPGEDRLAFADLSAHRTKAPLQRGEGEECEYDISTGAIDPRSPHGGTRNLKREMRAHMCVRAAHPAMRPGDAYIFETWGPRAAYHACAMRTRPPKGRRHGRRRSAEVRVALVV